MVKGIGYSIEVIIAITIVITFILGSIEINDNTEWSESEDDVSARDLTYVLSQSGYVSHTVKENEIGSLKTVASTISEKSTVYSIRGNYKNSKIKFGEDVDFETISTRSVGGVKNQTYEPYVIYLRWR